MKIKNLIQNNTVKFSHYREGNFYYNITAPLEPDEFFIRNYQFIVPADDIAGATLKNSDKAIFFMRWIKKAMDENTLVKV